MKITIGLLLITFQTVFGGVPSVQHIINGTDVAPGEAPYMAGLRRNDEDIYCGGALISNKHVLTIAHCADGYKTNNITVLLGTNDLLNGGQYYTIENISVSSDYNEKNSVGIAVLTLTREVEFSNVLDKISLPAMDAPDDGSSVLTGYGYQKKDKENGHMSQILQKLQVNIFNQSNCAKILQQHEILQPQHLCGFTGTSYGACYGDSGSPLIYNNTLIGLALSVYPDCAEGCCWCCSALRPRYKRLVDNIFPVNPQDGLIKNNMEKLMFYSLSSPEKLDRIGEYLFQRASRDISRRRNGFVVIAMEAMDQLLAACHAQTLNLFVESFLKMVQKLLESTDPQLQILATQSFVRFANIEEDTPSYHTRYDFFVSKYSSMCHSNNDDSTVRKQIRLAGIQGLQGVVRKTVSDDLVENIWNMVHMDKIVPSLLYNMQNARYSSKENSTPESPTEERSDPPQFAETCMRELVGRASFGHIRCVIKPVLKHLDNHQLWVPNYFAIHTFRIIMFSIQSQYSYTVVEALMTHLDEHSQSSPKIRTSIADTLSKIISIAAGESVGPSVLEIISSLLTHLRVSVSRNQSSTNDEQLYQEALINGLGEFANHLPDYQKIEIMKFIMSKVPYGEPDSITSAGKTDVLLQSILLKSLLKVGTKYQTINLNATFPPSFLQPLLKMSLASDAEMRLLVQKIFHTLIDRHKNIIKLAKPTVNVIELDLVIEKASRPDIIFIRKHGPEIYMALYESLEMISNRVDNVGSIYTTLALLTVELATEETVLELLRLVMSLQDLALTSHQLNIATKFNLHAIVISLLALIAYICNISTLTDYVNKIVESRRKEAPHLLPDLHSQYEAHLLSRISASLLIDQTIVTECLKGVGLETGKLQQGSGYSSSSFQHRHSWVDSAGRSSLSDINGGNTELDSAGSSPGVQRKLPGEELTFDNMKRILTENNNIQTAEDEKRTQFSQLFKNAPFPDLIKKTQPKHDVLQNKLSEIFNTLMIEPRSQSLPGVTPSDAKPSQAPAYEIHFPELFVY